VHGSIRQTVQGTKPIQLATLCLVIDLQQALIRLFCLTLCVANHGQTHERTFPT